MAHNGLHRWVHRNPPARRCVSLSMGTPRRAGPPYGLPAQATTQGGQFWTPIGGQYSTPVDSLILKKQGQWGRPPLISARQCRPIPTQSRRDTSGDLALAQEGKLDEATDHLPA